MLRYPNVNDGHTVWTLNRLVITNWLPVFRTIKYANDKEREQSIVVSKTLNVFIIDWSCESVSRLRHTGQRTNQCYLELSFTYRMHSCTHTHIHIRDVKLLANSLVFIYDEPDTIYRRI